MTNHGVPIEFYHGDDHPECKTVGELIEQLQRLPKDLRCKCGMSGRLRLVVYNIDRDRHLAIEEGTDVYDDYLDLGDECEECGKLMQPGEDDGFGVCRECCDDSFLDDDE